MNESTYKPRNFRLVRHVTKNRILDIQDALDIGKLRIELVEFVEGEGAKASVEHFAEPDALAVVCYDILQGRPFEKYVEFKGSAQGENVISRVLVVERVEARNPFKITVSRGPGKVMGQGAIQPLGKPEVSLSMLLSEFDARRIAMTVLRHMAAYEAATYHARVEANTRRVDDVAPARAERERAERPVPTASVPEPDDETTAPAAQCAPAQPAQQQTKAPAPAPAVQASSPAPVSALTGPQLEPEPAQPAPAPRRMVEPAVETYWMAAQRLGVPRGEAERILEETDHSWPAAWKVLRSWREREPQRN